MDTKMVCASIISSIMGDHGGIPKAKRQVELYENKLEEPTPPMGVILDVGLTPIVPVGIKPEGRDRSILGKIYYEILVVTLDVEVTDEP